MLLKCEIMDMMNEVYMQVIVYTLNNRVFHFLDGKCLLELESAHHRTLM